MRNRIHSHRFEYVAVEVRAQIDRCRGARADVAERGVLDYCKVDDAVKGIFIEHWWHQVVEHRKDRNSDIACRDMLVRIDVRMKVLGGLQSDLAVAEKYALRYVKENLTHVLS